MKKTTSLLRILLTLALLLSLLPAPKITAAPAPIAFVDITDIDAPVTGRTPDFTALASWDTFTIAAISWEAPDDIYQPFTEYSVVISLEAKDGYFFASGVDARVNGQDATIVSGAGTQEMKLLYTFPKTKALYDCIDIVYSETDIDAVVGDTIKVSLITDLPMEDMDADATFQWYKASSNIYGTGILIPGAVDFRYTVPTSRAGTAYYYCVVTAKVNGGTVTSESSDAALVKVTVAPNENISYVYPFTDVPGSAYYSDAVAWAVEMGITSGVSDTKFSPTGACTRAQAVTFLWRAAAYLVPELAATPFTDVPHGSFYDKAVLWAVENGVTSGTSATHFSPNQNCTRAQIVTFLWRFAGSPEVDSMYTGFDDVPRSAYYADAVIWAAENGITSGTSATTFSPNSTCTRAQIVTLLYRAINEYAAEEYYG